MMRPRLLVQGRVVMTVFVFRSRLALLAGLATLALSLQGCLAATVAGAAVGTTAKVATTAIGVTVHAAGAAGRAATGGSGSK